jgi:NAD-dependent SIR2 family protein deacetylase
MKRCSKCGEEKPPTEFRRDRSRKDGRYPQCKACERLWRQENAEYMADYHRRWQQANRDRKRAQDAATVSGSAGTSTIPSEGEPGIVSLGRGSELAVEVVEPARYSRRTVA